MRASIACVPRTASCRSCVSPADLHWLDVVVGERGPSGWWPWALRSDDRPPRRPNISSCSFPFDGSLQSPRAHRPSTVRPCLTRGTSVRHRQACQARQLAVGCHSEFPRALDPCRLCMCVDSLASYASSLKQRLLSSLADLPILRPTQRSGSSRVCTMRSHTDCALQTCPRRARRPTCHEREGFGALHLTFCAVSACLFESHAEPLARAGFGRPLRERRPITAGDQDHPASSPALCASLDLCGRAWPGTSHRRPSAAVAKCDKLHRSRTFGALKGPLWPDLPWRCPQRVSRVRQTRAASSTLSEQILSRPTQTSACLDLTH